MQMSRIGATYVAQLKSLRWLETAGGSLDNYGVETLTSLAETLTYLSVAQNEFVTDTAWSSLVKFRALVNLNLSETGCTVLAVQQLPCLRELSMHGVRGTRPQLDVLVAESSPQLNVSCAWLSKP